MYIRKLTYRISLFWRGFWYIVSILCLSRWVFSTFFQKGYRHGCYIQDGRWPKLIFRISAGIFVYSIFSTLAPWNSIPWNFRVSTGIKSSWICFSKWLPTWPPYKKWSHGPILGSCRWRVMIYKFVFRVVSFGSSWIMDLVECCVGPGNSH